MKKLSEVTPPIGKILVVAKNGKKIPYFFTGSKLSLITLREQYEYFEVPTVEPETKNIQP